jgi:DNA-binding MarR family transcriptional regulator
LATQVIPGADPLTKLYRCSYVYVMAGDSEALGQALFALAPLVIRRRSRKLSLTASSALGTLERTGPQRLTDLAASEGVTQPSMTAVVSQLEDLGFAERRSDPGDGRVVLVAISQAGRRHLWSMRRAGASVFTVLIDKLPEQEAAVLGGALPALRRLPELAAESPDRPSRIPDAPPGPGPRPGRASQARPALGAVDVEVIV